MNVLILAGGLGTRIQPLFPDRPKGMIEFAGKPFLEHQMRMLQAFGLKHFVLCVSHQAEQITSYFGDGSTMGLVIEYAAEQAPLGTAGALGNAAKYFRGPTLVLNGDTLIEIDYRGLVAAHSAHRDAIGTLVVVETIDRSRYGQIVLDAGGKIESFREKGHAGLETGFVSAGVYVLEPRILELVQPNQKTSLELDVFPAALAAHEALYGIRVNSPFIDIGTPDGYQALKSKLDPLGG
jgi:NDP-sugar pyrophosphorylase family protein